MEKVSIIVPIYNTGKYLKKCINSLLSQTYSNIEIILVNDGSTDNSLVIAQEFVNKDSRIVLINKQNEGVSSARNEGINLVTGNYVIFIDSDDWIETTMIEILLNNIKKHKAQISCCQYDHSIPSDIGKIEIWDKDKCLEEFIIHKKINGALVNKLIDFTLIKDIRFDKNIRYGEDALFLWKILQNTSKFCMIDEILYHVTLHEDSATGGGFKPSRMDCIKAWSSIVDDLKNNKDNLYIEARARRGHMTFYSLYAMILFDYKNKDFEYELKQYISKDIKYLLKSKNIDFKVKIFSVLTLLNYHLVKKIVQCKK